MSNTRKNFVDGKSRVKIIFAFASMSILLGTHAHAVLPASCPTLLVSPSLKTTAKSTPFDRLSKELQFAGIQLKADNIFKGRAPLKEVLVEGHPHKITVSGRLFRSYVNRLEFTFSDLTALKGKRVLDVGAGFSGFTDVTNETFGAKSVAIDYSYKDVPTESLHSSYKDTFRLTRLTMDARQMTFPDGHFDLVVSNMMMCWFFFGSDVASITRIDDGIRILEEMIRVIKVGGEIRTTHVDDPQNVPSQVSDDSIVPHNQRHLI